MDNLARVNLVRSSFPNRVEQLTKPVVDSPKSGSSSPHIRALHSWLDSEKFEVKNGRPVAALVTRAMEAESDQGPLQERGCELLVKILKLPGGEGEILESGAIRLVATALRKHPQNARLQTHGCCLLAGIAFLSAENEAAVVEAGAAPLALAAIAAHPTAELLEQAFRLAWAVVGSPQPRFRLLAGGIVEAIAAAQAAFRFKLEVQRPGCAILTKLASYPDSTAFFEAGGLKALVAAMAAVSADVNDRLTGDALAAMRRLSKRPGMPAELHAAGAGPAAVATMRAQIRVERVQLDGVQMLHNLAVLPGEADGSPEQGARLSSFVDSIVAAMNAHPLSIKLVEAGVAALRASARTQALLGHAVDIGALNTVVAALGGHRAQPGLQTEGLGVLYDLVFKSGSMLTAWERCASISGGQGELLLAMQAQVVGPIVPGTCTDALTQHFLRGGAAAALPTVLTDDGGVRSVEGTAAPRVGMLPKDDSSMR